MSQGTFSSIVTPSNKRPREITAGIDARRYDQYEKERSTDIHTGFTFPIVNDRLGIIPDGASLWQEPMPPQPNTNNYNGLMEIYKRVLAIHHNKIIMMKYIHNMIQTAMCLLGNKNDDYVVKYIANGIHGVTFKLAYKDIKHAVKFLIYDEMFPSEQKTLSKFNSVIPEIAVKLHRYCYVHFPAQQFHVAIIVMDLIDGTLPDLLSQSTITKATVTNIANQVFTILDTMKKYKLSHCDMHLANIAYKILPNGGYKVLLIDFGWGSFDSTYSDIDFLSLLKGVMALQNTPAQREFAQLIGAQSQNRLSHSTYSGIISKDPSGRVYVNQKLVLDLFEKMVYSQYQMVKYKQSTDLINRRYNQGPRTRNGAIGPYPRLPQLNTRSLNPYNTRHIMTDPKSYATSKRTRVDKISYAAPICDELRCPNGTPSPTYISHSPSPNEDDVGMHGTPSPLSNEDVDMRVTPSLLN